MALLIYVDKNMHYSMLASIIQKAAIYSLLAVSLNLLNGFTGLFSLGQAGFMMVGAYTYAILTIPLDQHASVYQYFNGGIVNVCLPPRGSDLSWRDSSPSGFAWLVGKPCLQASRATISPSPLSALLKFSARLIQWDVLGPVTNASNILKKFPKFDSILTPVIISAFCIFLIVLLINSSYGRAFKAIREDEIAAEAMGINLAKTKMQAFLTSSFFAGIGGALLAMFQASVQARSFTSAMTYEILLIVVIGGIGSVTGSIIGSFLYIAASEWWLRFLDDSQTYLGVNIPFMRGGFRMVVFSVVIMLVVLFYRQGIMGTQRVLVAGNHRLLQDASSAKNKGKAVTGQWLKTYLHIENVTMQFGGVVAVNNLNLDVNKGEIVALIGPNGAGKTTAFNCVTGVYEPTNGKIEFMGEIIVENSPAGQDEKDSTPARIWVCTTDVVSLHARRDNRKGHCAYLPEYPSVLEAHAVFRKRPHRKAHARKAELLLGRPASQWRRGEAHARGDHGAARGAGAR